MNVDNISEPAEHSSKNKKQEILLQFAKEAARILKEKYNASKVKVDNSLFDINRFHLFSDIDLIVYGLDEKFYYECISEITELNMSSNFDILRAEDLNEKLKERIEKNGIEI